MTDSEQSTDDEKTCYIRNCSNFGRLVTIYVQGNNVFHVRLCDGHIHPVDKLRDDARRVERERRVRAPRLEVTPEWLEGLVDPIAGRKRR